MEIFLLFLIPAAFLASLGTLFFARTSKVQVGSALGLVGSSTIIALIPAALQNYGAAWGGGSQVDYGTYALMGFVGSLIFSLIVIWIKRTLTGAQQAGAGQPEKRSESIDSPD